MDNEKLNKLIGLRDRIKELEAVKCGLSHECVRIDRATSLPVTRNVPETVYERTGLCPPEIRSERISCGHTMARYVLEDALRLIDSAGPKPERLKRELTEVSDRIHALDHKKGYADTDLAELIEKKHVNPEEFSEIRFDHAVEKIRSIEAEHDSCVDQIGRLRKEILLLIERVIADDPKSNIPKSKSKYADLET